MGTDRQTPCAESSFLRKVGAQEHGRGTVLKVGQVRKENPCFPPAINPDYLSFSSPHLLNPLFSSFGKMEETGGWDNGDR